MIPQPPPGQGPIDPRGAFSPPPPPGGGPGYGPPMGFPPPMFMPPRQGGGFARAIFMTLATTIFGFSLALNVYLLVANGVFGGGTSEKAIESGDPKQTIAVVPISSAMLDTEASKSFDKFMSEIEKDANVQAVVIEIDTPGGSVTASDEMFHRIMEFKKNKPNTPVVAAMGGLAASGGYYVACGADYIFAQPSTLTGSIGVILPMYDAAELGDKWGIHDKTVESSGTPFKTVGSMLKKETPEQRAYLQDVTDKVFQQFKDVIKNTRSAKLTKPLDEIANGKVYLGPDAVTLGLVDKIGYQKDAYDYVTKLKGLSRRTIMKYENPKGLLDLLTSRTSLSDTKAAVTIDTKSIADLTTPRLMYLWRGQ